VLRSEAVSRRAATPRLRRFLAGLGLALAGCEGGDVTTGGYDLARFFPERESWFWKYDNAAREDEISYWHSVGETIPDGAAEPLWTFRHWVDVEQTIVDDFADGESDWALETYWARRDKGWHWMGWQAGASGNRPELGGEIFSGEGVPFAMEGVTNGRQWSVSVNERQWTSRVSLVDGALTVHEQTIEDAWLLELNSDSGDTPLEGLFWLALGPGVVQWDAAAFRPESGEAWTHLHNDTDDNILGQTR